MAETRRFLVNPEDVNGGEAVLTGGEAAHARNVLRLNPGDPVALIDGAGREYDGVIRCFFRGEVHVSLKETRLGGVESPLRLALAVAVLKTGKMDKLIRPLTELGVHALIPFFSARTVPRLKSPEERRKRWEKIAAEAAKQCGRAVLPAIGSPLPWEALVRRAPDYDLKIVFWERSRVLLDEAVPKGAAPSSVLAAVGPEGGFEDREITQLEAAGFIHAGLGPRTLRAETASLAAGILLQALFGDMGVRGRTPPGAA